MKDDFFNKYGLKPTFKDPETLKKFVSPRGKMLPADKTGLTAKNQRRVSKQIKHARYLALMPYTSYQSEQMKMQRKQSQATTS